MFPDHFVYTHVGSQREIEKALSCIRRSGCSIEEMELVQPDLEDVFVNLTTREDAA